MPACPTAILSNQITKLSDGNETSGSSLSISFDPQLPVFNLIANNEIRDNLSGSTLTYLSSSLFYTLTNIYHISPYFNTYNPNTNNVLNSEICLLFNTTKQGQVPQSILIVVPVYINSSAAVSLSSLRFTYMLPSSNPYIEYSTCPEGAPFYGTNIRVCYFYNGINIIESIAPSGGYSTVFSSLKKNPPETDKNSYKIRNFTKYSTFYSTGKNRRGISTSDIKCTSINPSSDIKDNVLTINPLTGQPFDSILDGINSAQQNAINQNGLTTVQSIIITVAVLIAVILAGLCIFYLFRMSTGDKTYTHKDFLKDLTSGTLPPPLSK